MSFEIEPIICSKIFPPRKQIWIFAFDLILTCTKLRGDCACGCVCMCLCVNTHTCKRCKKLRYVEYHFHLPHSNKSNFTETSKEMILSRVFKANCPVIVSCLSAGPCVTSQFIDCCINVAHPVRRIVLFCTLSSQLL